MRQLGLFIEDRISSELDRQPDESIIITHYASVFRGTDLQVRLLAKDIDTLIMVGVASTDAMLPFIAHASDTDYRLPTMKDCCYDPDPTVHERLFATAFESRTTMLLLAGALSLLG